MTWLLKAVIVVATVSCIGIPTKNPFDKKKKDYTGEPQQLDKKNYDYGPDAAQGRWKTECRTFSLYGIEGVMADDGASIRKFRVVSELEIKGESLVKTNSFFIAKSCAGAPVFVETKQANLKIGDYTSWMSDPRPRQAEFSGVTGVGRVDDDKIERLLNKRKACGLETWSKGKDSPLPAPCDTITHRNEREDTEESADFPDEPRTPYNAIRIDIHKTPHELSLLGFKDRQLNAWAGEWLKQ